MSNLIIKLSKIWKRILPKGPETYFC